MLLSFTVFAAIFSAISGAEGSPISLETATPGSVRIFGRRTAGQRELYRHPNGTFNLSFLTAEASAVHRKYGQHAGKSRGSATLFATPPPSLGKRATGRVALDDRIIYTHDIEYTGPMSEPESFALPLIRSLIRDVILKPSERHLSAS